MVSLLRPRLVRFLRREDGLTTVKYAVVLALIGVICIATIAALGVNADRTLSTIGNPMGTAS